MAKPSSSENECFNSIKCRSGRSFYARVVSLIIILLSFSYYSDASEDNDIPIEIHAWPLIEYSKLADGRHRTSMLLLYHHTTNPDGSFHSFHLANYFQGEDYQAFVPFYYRFGVSGDAHTGVLPLWFSGPRYRIIPPLLSGWFEEDGGDTSTWITPLFHINRDPGGDVTSFHALNYLYANNYHYFLPFFYIGGDVGDRKFGLIPFWFQGSDYAVSPLFLSAWWKTDDGGESLWLSPLFHASRQSDGSLQSLHFLNYYYQPDLHLLFPFAYWSRKYNRDHYGIIPLWFQGPDYWIFPPGLSCWSRDSGGDTSLWITPLFHMKQNNKNKLDSFHFLNYYHRKNLDIIFPIAWRSGKEGNRSYGLLPFWLSGPDWWVSPLALSCQSRDWAGNTSTWITPLFHVQTEEDGTIRSMHCLNYFQGRKYKTLFPIAWQFGRGENTKTAIIPFWFQTNDFALSPPLLSGWFRHDDGADSLWITPLFHITREKDYSIRSLHALNYYHRPNLDVLFPLGYVSGEPGHRQIGLIPLWFQGKDYWTFPLGLSVWQRFPDGSDTLWVTPFFHRTRNSNKEITSLHLFNYFKGKDYDLLFPIVSRTGKPGKYEYALLPFWMSGLDYWYFLPGLSKSTPRSNGGRSTWITPLFHANTDKDDQIESMHALNYFRGKNYDVFFPLAWRVGEPNRRHYGLLPLWMSGPDYWTVPLGLSCSHKRDDGSRSTWITPLFHTNTDKDGNIESMHALNYFGGKNYDIFFPLAWRVGEPNQRHYGLLPFWMSGPDYWTVPLGLSCSHKRDDGSRSTWITPLFHTNTDKDGEIESMHALNYFGGKNYDIFFPLAWRVGEPNQRHYGLLLFWMSGPNYWAVPLGLSYSRNIDYGGRSTWITPLFHTNTDKNGDIESMHALNYFSGKNYDVFFPLAWRVGEPNQRHYGLLPFWMSGPNYWTVPLGLSYSRRHDDGGRSTWITPLFHTNTGKDGQIESMHALNYFRGKNYDVIFPLAWRTGEPNQRHYGFLPLWMSGPDYWFVFPAISGQWRQEYGDKHTLFTPFYYKQTDRQDNLKYIHCFNYIANEDFRTLFPIYWNWITDAGNQMTIVPPLYAQFHKPSGEQYSSILFPLFGYYAGKELNTGLAFQFHPFSYQTAGDDYAFNFLWRAFQIQRQNQSTTVRIAPVIPVWWSEHQPQSPSKFQFLGGLVARDCNYEKRIYRYRLLWLIPISSRKTY